jgi:hypothetical protein
VVCRDLRGKIGRREIYFLFFFSITIAVVSAAILRSYKVVPPSFNRSMLFPPSVKKVPLVKGLAFGAAGILWGAICGRTNIPDNWIGVFILFVPSIFLGARGAFYALEGLGYLEKL